MKAVYISAKGDLKTGTSSDVASYIYKTGSEEAGQGY